MKLRGRYRLYILLFFGFGANAQRQNINLYFHHFDKYSGIPQSVCNDVFRDSRGFTWITTISGLYRFDGLQFMDALGNNRQVKSHALKDIAEDRTGDLWVTKNDDELVHFNPYNGALEIVSLRPFLQPRNVSVQGLNLLHVDGLNRIWIGINQSGIACYDITKRALKIIFLPDMSPAYSLAFFPSPSDQQPVLFRKSQGSNLLYRGKVDLALNIQWESKQNARVNTGNYIYATDAQNLWYIDSNSLVNYNWNTNTTIRYSHACGKNEEVLEPLMLPDSRKRLWISFKKGIICFNTIQRQFTHSFMNNPDDVFSIKYNSTPVLCDEEDNLWFTTFGSGFSFCNLSSFRMDQLLNQRVAEKNDISNFIRALITDHQGNIYFSAEGSGIAVLDSSGKFKKMLLKENGASFEVAYRDRSGRIWLGGLGLYVYDPGEKRFVQSNTIRCLLGSRISSILQLQDGNMLVGTYTHLFRVDPGSFTAQEVQGIQDLHQIFSFLYELPGNELLVGLRDRGLKRYRSAGKGYTLLKNIHSSLFVKSALRVSSDELWLATTEGMYSYRVSNGLLQPLAEVNQKLPNQYLYAVMQDGKGYTWVSSNAGLFRWKNNDFKSFGITEGIQGSEFNTNAFCKADNGLLYFGGVNGINRIESITPDSFYTYGTRLQLLKVTASDTLFLRPDQKGEYAQISLQPGNTNLAIEYNTINFFQPGKYKVQYRLSRYNESWQTADASGTARFVNLKPGAYQFEIRLYNPDNLQPGTIYQLPVYLIPFWWQTMAFKVMAVIFLLALGVLMIVWMFRYRLRQERLQLEKQLAVARERERIIADLHDDIGATLSSMNIYSELASEVMNEKPEEGKSLMHKISGISKELMGRMGDIIWSMKPADEEKYTLEARLKNYCSELLSPKNILFELDIDPQLAASVRQPEFRKNLLLIAREAVNNIAKYSGAGKAGISFKEVEGAKQLLIWDDGRGFEAGTALQGNGLSNIRQRCSVLGGECDITSTPGKGVRVCCRFV